MWLPDRLMDLADVVSFDVGLGAGVGLDAHVTRAAQLGAEAGASMGLGWHPQRSLGLRMRHAPFAIGAAQRDAWFRHGDRGRRGGRCR